MNKQGNKDTRIEVIQIYKNSTSAHGTRPRHNKEDRVCCTMHCSCDTDFDPIVLRRWYVSICFYIFPSSNLFMVF